MPFGPLIVFNRGLSKSDRDDLREIRKALSRIADTLELWYGGQSGTGLRSFYRNASTGAKEKEEVEFLSRDDEWLALAEAAEHLGAETVQELWRRHASGELEGFLEELKRRTQHEYRNQGDENE